MYRWLPSEADMREVDPERFGGSRDAGAVLAATAAPVLNGSAALLSTQNSPIINAINVMDGGRAASSTPTQVANRAQAIDAGVRIEDLQGTAGSPLLRRMLAGMYISVDREMSSAGRRFWRTQNGGYVERGAVSLLRTPPSFQGVTLDQTHPLPMAFMVAFEGYSYDLSPDGRRVVRREQTPRLTAFHLTSDPPVTVGRENYYKTSTGVYLRERNIRMVQTSNPPAEVGPTEKWIEVNLDRQMLIAYEGARPVYVTLISSGRRNRDNEERNYETVQGGFRIQSKHIATTMDGNSAGDGPYSIEDVPWVMYFENSFALHGAFWHNLFGYMRSHGCVNMAPADARWVFQWSEPQVPVGWHGVFANDRTRPGTRIYVHYERQPLGERGGPRVVPQH
jgi:lipoprotein-anchoring transpeptidase ErfK/SrfK